MNAHECAVVVIRVFGLIALVLAVPKVFAQIGGLLATLQWLNWQVGIIGHNLETARASFGFSFGDLLGAFAQAGIGFWLLVGCSIVERRVSRGLWRLRSRCAGCGYDLSGVDGTTCPECGSPRLPGTAIDSPHEREANETP